MPATSTASADSTPKTTPLTRRVVRQTPSSIFHVERSTSRPDDRNVTKRSETRKGRRCPSPFHVSCSCPSLIDACDATPNSFAASLRNYNTTPKKQEKKKVESEMRCPQSPASTSECALVVAVRMRPFNKMELDEPNLTSVIDMDPKYNTVRIRNTNNEVYSNAVFNFDYIFNGMNDQEVVYNSIGERVLDVALEGYNACLFAYGQTGSGKTHSIIGTDESPGIIPRFGKELFERISMNENIVVELSYFEIYNEKIHDLLSDDSKKKALKVRENPTIGPYVVNLSVFSLDSNEDFQSFIALGNTRRVTGANGVNERSSRAHAICTINIVQNNLHCKVAKGSEVGTVLTSKVNIVDLAGSERASQVNSSGERLKEGVAINKSLLTLRKVITQLAERSSNTTKNVHVPYRESTLTWLLSESLGCNSRTFMLATISPSVTHIDETMSTLRYACQSRKIVNVVRINEDPKAVKIRQLLNEIDSLKRQQIEFEAWQKEKLKLDDKRQLIMKYEVEVEDLKRLLAEAKRQLDQRENVVQSKKTAEKSQQTIPKSPFETKSVEVNTSLIKYETANKRKRLFEDGETGNKSASSENEKGTETVDAEVGSLKSDKKKSEYESGVEASDVMEKSAASNPVEKLQISQSSEKCLHSINDTNDHQHRTSEVRSLEVDNGFTFVSDFSTVIQNSQFFQNENEDEFKYAEFKTAGEASDVFDQSSASKRVGKSPIAQSSESGLHSISDTNDHQHRTSEVRSLEVDNRFTFVSDFSTAIQNSQFFQNENEDEFKYAEFKTAGEASDVFDQSSASKRVGKSPIAQSSESGLHSISDTNDHQHRTSEVRSLEVDNRFTFVSDFSTVIQNSQFFQNENEDEFKYAEFKTAGEASDVFDQSSASKRVGKSPIAQSSESDLHSISDTNDHQHRTSEVRSLEVDNRFTFVSDFSTAIQNSQFFQNENEDEFKYAEFKTAGEASDVFDQSSASKRVGKSPIAQSSESGLHSISDTNDHQHRTSEVRSLEVDNRFTFVSDFSTVIQNSQFFQNENEDEFKTAEFKSADEASDVFDQSSASKRVGKSPIAQSSESGLHSNSDTNEIELMILKNGKPNEKVTANGESIEESHGIFILEKDTLRLVPNLNAQTIVNHNYVSGPTILKDGDHLVLDGEQHFRISLPKKTNVCEETQRKSTKSMTEKSSTPSFLLPSKRDKSDFLQIIHVMFAHLFDESFMSNEESTA